MSNRTTLPLEVEQRRQKLVSELAAENGPDWLANYAPGSFGCHELLDRALLAAEMVEHTLVDHPACAQNPDWYALAEQAMDALHSLYQRVGAAHLADATDDNSQS
jgi:hypothetical protein